MGPIYPTDLSNCADVVFSVMRCSGPLALAPLHFVWITATIFSTLSCSRSPQDDVSAASAAQIDPLGKPGERRSDQGDALEYTVRFEQAHNHYIDVELHVATDEAAETTLMMAVWTPGSYLVREYARHIEDLRALDSSGQPRAIRKTHKNRWTVSSQGAKQLTVRYRLYSRELSVRTNFVDSDIAVVIGAATFLTVPKKMDATHDVLFVPRSGWAKVVTGLDRHPDGAANHFIASSYDELVDSPMVVGNPVEDSFEVSGAAHRLATFASTDAWDSKKASADVEKIVAEHIAFWRTLPYERYLFLNPLLTRGGLGGLEHLDSTLLMASRFAMATPKNYRRWLGLVSHEYFHTWNGKRLRPKTLGPFDYEHEVHTRDLWVVEGLTSYYDDLLLVRAGLYTEKQYLEALGGQIAKLQKTPGRLSQPLSQASYDAWIKFYRYDENSDNSSISYYTKGAVVGFLLDARIRQASAGKASLDDVMRVAFDRFGGTTGYTSEQFREVASEIAGTDLSDFFARAVDGTDELDYRQALGYFGLRFKPAVRESSDDTPPSANLGAKTAAPSGRIMVTQVNKDTPAFSAGINVGDELLAIDGERIPQQRPGGDKSGLDEALSRIKPGTEVEFTVARRNQLRSLKVTLGEPTLDKFVLERDPRRTATSASRAAQWLAQGKGTR